MDAIADATLSLPEPTPQLRSPEPAIVSCAAGMTITAMAAQQSTAPPPGPAQDLAAAAATATTQPDAEAAEAATEIDEVEVEIVEDNVLVEVVDGDPKQPSPDATPTDVIGLTMQALTAAWRNVSKRKMAAKSKPVPDADEWQICRVEHK